MVDFDFEVYMEVICKSLLKIENLITFLVLAEICRLVKWMFF